MREQDFRDWMQAQGNSPATVSTRISDARRVERHYGDLDEAYDRDRFATILQELTYSAADQAAGKPNPSRLQIDGQLATSLASYRGVLSIYSTFRGGRHGAQSQADAIRAFVTDTFIEPAREQGRLRFTVRAGDVHSAMGLQNAMPAVCSGLGGRKLWDSAGVTQVARDGPANGGNAVFHYEFVSDQPFSMAVTEATLRQRYGAPVVDSQKIAGFALSDGRQIAVQRDINKVQLWVEADGQDPPVAQLQRYEATKGRHSNLPDRLSHTPSAGVAPRPVLSIRVANPSELKAVLDWYDGGEMPLNRDALEELKRRFLARYPDFEPGAFGKNQGGYFEEERAYKDALIERAQAALTEAKVLDDEELGVRFLDLLIGRESGLLGWRTDARIKKLREGNPGQLERLAGQLVRSDDPLPAAVDAFVQQAWPMLEHGQETNKPYSESRNIPSMIAALAKPRDGYGINTDPVHQTYRALFGQPPFANQPLTADEYARVLTMVRRIEAIMRDDWGWKPRDLWDVQGFIWAVNRADTPEAELAPHSPGAKQVPPTNLILYGPPGTGKTYRTAYEAVRLCDGDAPDSRSELKKRYDTLVDAGQIAFVTFHQSYAYEDFVEGLRPTTSGVDEDDTSTAGGFRLEPRRGIFRDIAMLAEQARKTANQPGGFDLSGRQYVKMSLGRAGAEDHVYDAAIDGNYIVLGWGGEVDWSDPKYDDYQAIFDKWNSIEPGTSGNSGNIAQVWRFRAGMKEGDIVIVSEGNSQFRAIGEVTGPYHYEPTGFGTYNHRRSVRWLLVLDEPLPVDTIYDGAFTMMSCYGLKESKVKKEALSRLLPGTAPAERANPDQFVLIIDEINRANISKVFGELITLIEPDKRLGETNALRLKLPYSGDVFGVPNNLHLVGTMNTADRSIALLDTALRRRFEFRELMPDPMLLPEEVDGVPLRNLLRTINGRIEYLFDREHQVGHAYFIGCQSKADIDRTMHDKVIPLLQEYFYEDWAKVASVLGDSEGAGYFLERAALTVPVGTNDQIDERFRWSVKPSFDGSAYEQFR
jgi:hypothetical protein